MRLVAGAVPEGFEQAPFLAAFEATVAGLALRRPSDTCHRVFHRHHQLLAGPVDHGREQIQFAVDRRSRGTSRETRIAPLRHDGDVSAANL